MPCRTALFLCCILIALQPARLHAAQIELNVADIAAPSFSAKGIVVTLSSNGSADLRIAEAHVSEKSWNQVHLHCGKFLFGSRKVECRDGKLAMAPDLPFNFSYEIETKKLELALAAKGKELWQLKAGFQAQPWHVTGTLCNAQASRLAALLPEGWPVPTKGTLDGSVALHGNSTGLLGAHAELQLQGGSFSDASGLHAGENFQATLQFDATHAEGLWSSGIKLEWQSGELFWRPFYLHGGHSLSASVTWDGKLAKLEQGTLTLGEIGQLEFDGLWNVAEKKLLDAQLHGSNLGLARLYADYAKPFLAEGAAATSEVSGSADLNWKFSQGATQLLGIRVHDASLIDPHKRFSLRGLNADIPWSAEQTSQATLSLDSAALWGVPLGPINWQVGMAGFDFSIPAATLPIMDGKLSIQDFHLLRENEAWRWEFSGALTPISMPLLSVALGWPEMQGSLSGMIPHVTYQDKALKVDGALLFRVFDGRVVVSSLHLSDPLGPAPRLYGNLNMMELDLGALTQAFSFGNVQGRIDVSVNELELVNWLPVRFDAKVSSSPGWYRKRISQKAVQNISALGGAGATAAVQRSVMSIFENFGYSRIILSCVLRNGVCAMDGESTQEGNYYIVKGGGIPAINVMGYNHSVDWDELLDRLKRVTKGNRKAVVE